jgi:hypothetical protein
MAVGIGGAVAAPLAGLVKPAGHWSPASAGSGLTRPQRCFGSVSTSGGGWQGDGQSPATVGLVTVVAFFAAVLFVAYLVHP